MTIALLATGDEIVHGDTLNTNAYKIAQAISSEGLALGLHMACSDKEQDIISCIEFLQQQHDIIIITGGLGPTSDDKTRFALAAALKMPLFEHKEALEHIEKRLSRSNIAMSSNNRQQALFPRETYLMDNPHGTALGAYGNWGKCLFFLLPGPPRECLPMFQNFVLPKLQEQQHSHKIILKWLVFGMAESRLAHLLEPVLNDIDCQTGYRLDSPYIEFKVRCHPEKQELIQLRVSSVIKEHMLSEDRKKASVKLSQAAEQWHQVIAITDRASGGLLQTLTQSPDNYQKLCFYPDPDASLQILITGLDAFWQKKAFQGETRIKIEIFKADRCIHQESKDIPYTSELVLSFAAEWLSFRLFHLIHELH